MSYLSLYRKYRSQTFSDLIGQDHVVRTLQNAMTSGKIAHSYLFTGPRGTGKTSSARLLSKCLNCEKGPTPEPCNVCDQCVSITIGNCVDVYEFDAASESGVEQVRETIVDAVQYAPNYCRYKIFIIDEVHDLSAKAFDALLKTIEEPPEYVIFILATTEFNKVPPTIRSRCQKFEFHRATMQNLIERLSYVATSEGIDSEPAALSAIARMADGGYRDALTLLEQAMLTSETTITLQHVYDQLGLVSEETVDQILISMKEGNVPTLLDTLNEIARRGRDPRSIVESIMYRLSDLTRAAYTVDIGSSQDATREAALFETAARIGRENLLRLRGMISESHRAIREVSLPRIWLEAELIRISNRMSGESPVQVQPQREKPKAVSTEKEKPVQAVVEQKPEQKREPKPEPKVEAAPIAVKPNDWSSVVHSLSAMSRAMGMRLNGTKANAVEASVVKVHIERQMDLEWLTDSPKKVATINEHVQKVFGDGFSVEFIVTKSEVAPKLAANEAVELPMEGEALYKAAAEAFKTN